MKYFLLFILFPFSYCHRQNDVSLTFINKSPLTIDSVVIKGVEIVNLGPLPSGEKYSYKAKIILRDYSEGIFMFNSFTGSRSLFGTWAFMTLAGWKLAFASGHSPEHSLIERKYRFIYLFFRL